ncbi:MAG: NAD(P)H-dependent oxidoreductase [Dermatophilaceae bacterium]
MIELRIVVASTRPVRLGPTIADWVRNSVPGDVFAVEVIDLAELALPFLDEPQMPSSGVHTKAHTLRWKALVDAADAMVVVMPEYNGSFNAPLKNAIDYLYAEWHDLPVALVGYGHRGAAGAMEALGVVLRRVKARQVEGVSLFLRTHIEDGVVRPDAQVLGAAGRMFEALREAVEAPDSAGEGPSV